MIKMLEQITYENLRIPERRQVAYSIADLTGLGASVLYGDGSEEYKRYIDETIRYDDHIPFGQHLNYELWLKLHGKKEGRNIGLTNVHIQLGELSSGNGY